MHRVLKKKFVTGLYIAVKCMYKYSKTVKELIGGGIFLIINYLKSSVSGIVTLSYSHRYFNEYCTNVGFT